MQINPNDYYALYGLSNLAYINKQPQRCLEISCKLLQLPLEEREEEEEHLYINYVWALKSLGDAEKASTICLSGLQRYPNDPTLLMEHAGLLYQKREWQKAEAAYDKVGQHPRFRANAQGGRAACLFELGNRKQAIEIAKIALVQSPESAYLHHCLGLFTLREGFQEKALDHAKSACLLAPDHANYLFELGFLLALRKEFTSALTHFERAFCLDAEHIQARIFIALCHQALGEPELCNQELQNLIALDTASVVEAIEEIALRGGYSHLMEETLKTLKSQR